MAVDLLTPQGERLSHDPWQEYPRPQMKRESYVNLNGYWDFTVTEHCDLPECYDRQILVPFCPESQLSGIKEHFTDGAYLCYRKVFTLPESFSGKQVLLHIGAADQVAEVFCNGELLCRHEGGYEAFTAELTNHLKEKNELVIRVTDDLRDQSFPYGKQVLKRGGMWYTPVSGIWQTVWMEAVPETYIEKLQIRFTDKSATVTVLPTQEGCIELDGKTYPLEKGTAVITPEDPKLWSPENPHLYYFTLKTATDQVESYFALRSLEVKNIAGIPRLCLNGKPYFFHGLLDQGYWSDGIYTPAHPECYSKDIWAMKALGFNTLRKHIKVEPEQFYYDCDRLGMVVFQDMVNNGPYSFFRDTALPTVGLQKLPDKNLHKDALSRKRFTEAMAATVRQLENHPCICYWTIFNEGWGQFDSDRVYEEFKKLDPTRFVDSTSGWFRQKSSDVESLHIYFGSWKNKIKTYEKPLVLSEFGGFCYACENHLFSPENAYGYRNYKTLVEFNSALQALYTDQVIPAIKEGLCAAIYTQVSDVEDECNGLLTYDRKVCKPDGDRMREIAYALQKAMQEETT